VTGTCCDAAAGRTRIPARFPAPVNAPGTSGHPRSHACAQVPVHTGLRVRHG
jgi:hypothetical protein